MNHSQIYSEAAGKTKPPEVNKDEKEFLSTVEDVNKVNHQEWLNNVVTQDKLNKFRAAYQNATTVAQNKALICINDESAVASIKAAVIKEMLKVLENL